MNSFEYDLMRGDWFEENVSTPWILLNKKDYWIDETRLHNKPKNKKGGPRLSKNGLEIILPDYRCDNPNTGELLWIDSKLKKKSFKLDSNPGEYYYSIDPRSYRDYQILLTEFKKTRLEILLGCERTKRLMLFDLTKVKPIWHQFHNEYTRYKWTLTPCFAETDMTVVGSWDPNEMYRALNVLLKNLVTET